MQVVDRARAGEGADRFADATVEIDRRAGGEQGAIEAPLPPALAPTPYSRLGDCIFLVLLLVSALSAFRLDVRRRLSDTARPSA